MVSASSYRFRSGTPDDAETMHATAMAGFETYRDFAPPGWDPPYEVGPEAERSRVERERTWVLMGETLDGAPAGHVAFTPATESRWRDQDPDLVHLWQLFVLPPHWGSGLATTLLRQSRDEAAKQGYRTMRLYTPTGQARARRFYEREGFVATGEPIFEAQLGLEIIEYRGQLV